MSLYHLPLRLKRLRKTETIRALLRENALRIEQFVAPLFINENLTHKKEISSMPGQFQLSLADLPAEIDELVALNVQAVLLFGIPATKDEHGSAALHESGIIQQAIRRIRQQHPSMLIISDVCFCEYTNHGHCGLLKNNCIDNDKTLTQLSAQAISHAEAGADWVAPSAMADGMVLAIRQGLDQAGFMDTAILSYAVKYSSHFYGPFREAAQGAPQFGDRKHYQMDFANSHEALREAALDIHEGADLIMVKPAMNYLDIIYQIKTHYPDIPLGAYQVSGEYAMLKQAAKAKLLNEKDAVLESLMAIKRAGADFIISYFTKDIARYLR